ncbi:MAG: hypothetical protein Q9210_003761 [Variospora velana]
MLPRPTHSLLARRLFQPRSQTALPRDAPPFRVSCRRYAFNPRRRQYNRFQKAGALWRTSPPFRIGVLAVGGGIVVWVGSNIEQVPASGRWRFNCVSEEYEAELGRMGYQQTMRELRGELLGPSDPRHKMVGRTLARLLPNSGLKGDWEFHVIDDPNEINAFVIPGGKVFVYSGILPICKNEDGLAAVLGHEIAHTMCHHVQENASLPWLITLVVGLVSIFLDNSASVTQLVLDYALELPNSRAQEVGAHGKSTEDYGTTTALYSSHCTSRPAAYAAEIAYATQNKNRIKRIQEWSVMFNRSASSSSLKQSKSISKVTAHKRMIYRMPMTLTAAKLPIVPATSGPSPPTELMQRSDNAFEQVIPRTTDSSTSTYGSTKPPAFQYNASLHPLDTAPPQAHPAIVSPQPPTPLSAGLQIQTHLDFGGNSNGEKGSLPLPLSPSADTEIPIYQAPPSGGIPGRSGSVRSVLSARGHRSASLSPGSAFSSPGIGPLVDITPLPSPMAALGSSSPWDDTIGHTDTKQAAAEIVSIAEDGESNGGTISFTRNSPKKHRIPLRIDSEVMKINAASHARNRSLSDYVPEGIPVPRTRNIVVSGMVAPMSATPESPLDQSMHREEYLAVQRGIALPIPKPPTPPQSDRAIEEPRELESRSLSPPVHIEPSALIYTARVLGTEEPKSWRAVRQLGKGTFSTVMLATSQDVKSASSIGQSLVDESRLDPKSLVAVKICEQGPAGGANEQKVELSLKRELEIMKAIHHHSLVRLKAVSIEDRRALLILNYCPGGDLFELASLKLALLVPSLVRRIFAELVAAVRYLHSMYIVHRDIKLENVLVNLSMSELTTVTDWQTYPYPVVTLTDLGLGRWIPKPPESPMLDTRCGSEDYAAPEVLMGQEYDGRATDAWALGVLLYAIMEGRLPFDPIPGSRRKSPTSHRIARCEWSWVKWADSDGEWDPVKGEPLEGARTVVEGLLLRASRRWSLEKVQAMEWVSQGLAVAGGPRLRYLSTTRRRQHPDDSDPQLNKVSQHVTQPKSQGASQAMLYATGLQPSDMSKAQVGIASVWYSGNPCNMHLLGLNHKVKEGVERSGLIGYQFNTVGVSDAISMGTKGMRYSLQSRDLIANSIETVMGGQWYDANISIPGCDKNMPGVVMAMGRVNRPSLMVYGGTIKPGCAKTQNNANIDIISAFQSYGQFITGEINEEERFDIIRNACPGGGACGGMYTANTMATAIETMGMTLPGSSSNPAESKAKMLECLAAGGAIKKLLVEDIRPSDIITREALENAMVVIMITGGSTNAVLHLIAIAHSVGIKLTIDDFQSVSDRIPFLADLKPSGKYVMADLHNIGGTPSLLKYLLKESIITGNGMTVTGQTLAKNLENVPDFPSDQVIIKPLNAPIKKTGHIQILRGSLAPGGCVGKITGKEGMRFTGKAKVFDSEDDMVLSLEQGAIKKGEKTVVIIRYEGPKGGPGMPEMLKPSSAIMGAGLGQDVALLTDGRFSGGSHGFLIGHIVPEAQAGGPIALVRNGDEIVIDAETRKLDVLVSKEELENRRKDWKRPKAKYERGTLAEYGTLVADASHGCITDSAELRT